MASHPLCRHLVYAAAQPSRSLHESKGSSPLVPQEEDRREEEEEWDLQHTCSIFSGRLSSLLQPLPSSEFQVKSLGLLQWVEVLVVFGPPLMEAVGAAVACMCAIGSISM